MEHYELALGYCGDGYTFEVCITCTTYVQGRGSAGHTAGRRVDAWDVAATCMHLTCSHNVPGLGVHPSRATLKLSLELPKAVWLGAAYNSCGHAAAGCAFCAQRAVAAAVAAALRTVHTPGDR